MLQVFDFSEALKRLKQNKKIARSGWNGKAMFVFMNRVEAGDGYVIGVDGVGKWYPLADHFLIKSTGEILNTWVPSVSDLLAEDWQEV